jgi:hypothetical protein
MLNVVALNVVAPNIHITQKPAQSRLQTRQLKPGGGFTIIHVTAVFFAK